MDSLLQGLITNVVASNVSLSPELPEVPETSEPAETEPAPTEPVASEPVASEPSQEPAPAAAAAEEEEPDVPAVTVPPIFEELGNLSAVIYPDQVESAVSAYMSSSLVKATAGAMAGRMMSPQITAQLSAKLAQFGNMLMNYMGSSITVDEQMLASAFQFNMTEEELMRLMQAMAGRASDASAKVNLQNLGYAELDDPTYMYIYMVDFAAKETFMDFLDGYNEKMLAQDKEDRVIRYTDVTGIMMSSVRTIIDSVSYALIAFVAVSLVVSSIMIGIITYISVMERTKEIGVLRAIGASKRNITQVFNAETFIIGLFSGVLGIGITLLILIPGNQLILHLTNNPDIVAQLPVANAAALIALSVALTLIGGIIPAKQAAKKDPVIALRSE
jgi:ABC-type antimicrobial peptide transport system permease subunit